MVGSRPDPQPDPPPAVAPAGLDRYLTDALASSRRYLTKDQASPAQKVPEGPDPFAWQAQSLLLGRPGGGVSGQLNLLRLVVTTLDAPVGRPLRRFIDHVAGTPTRRLLADYVATFDRPDCCCLFLTYDAHGDTCHRDTALRRLTEAYAASGLRLTGGEVPDHLAVVLEYAAAEPGAGAGLLIEHRAGLQLLRLALRDAHSPWADVLDSVWATLPPMVGDEWLAVARLAALRPEHEHTGTGRPGSPSIPHPRAAQPQGARR